MMRLLCAFEKYRDQDENLGSLGTVSEIYSSKLSFVKEKMKSKEGVVQGPWLLSVDNLN